MSLPHLTWLLRTHRILTVETPAGVELDARLDALDPFKNRISLQLEAHSPPVEEGDTLRLSFGFAGQRWSARVLLHHVPNRSLFVVDAPSTFEAADRRVLPRWVPAESFGRVVVRTELGEGWELQGAITSLSEGGLAMRIQRTSGPDSEGPRGWVKRVGKGRKLPSVAVYLQEGKPALDGEGVVAWVANGKLGLRLRGLTESDREKLKVYLAALVKPLPDLLPEVPESELLVATLPEAQPQARAERSAALRRLKRRGRSLVLAMRPGRAREALGAFLTQEGYGQVRAVETLAQWLDLVGATPPDLVFIDGGVRDLQGLELASFLHQSRGRQDFAVVLAEHPMGTTLPQLAREAGVDRLVEKPYLLEPPLVEALDEVLEAHKGEAAGAAAPAATGPILMLAMPPGPEREALGALLTAQIGGLRLRPVFSLAELVLTARDPDLAMVFVDWEEEGLPSLEVAAFLLRAFRDRPVPLVVACPRGRPQVLREGRELGATQVILRPYALDGALVTLFRRILDGPEPA